MIISLKTIVIIGSLLRSGSLDAAMAKAHECETETSWAEQVAPGLWRGVCGDENGEEVLSSCQARAELRYAMAESAGADADGAYEDALAMCEDQ